MTGAAVGLLLLQAAGPEYPLGPLPERDLTDPRPHVVLADVFYRVSEQLEAAQTLAARLRLGRWAYLGLEFDDQQKRVSLSNHRLEASFSEDQGRYALVAGYRGPWFRLRTDADRRASGQGAGWVVGGQSALRLSPDLEILAEAEFDTDPGEPLGTRPIRTLSLGALYQRGPAFEVTALATRTRVRTAAGFDQDVDQWSATGAGLLLGAEWSGLAGFEREGGRLGREEAFGTLSARVPVGERVLAEGFFGTSWEPGVKRFEQELRGSLALHGRKVHLSRAGEAARLVYSLARKANGMGLNERRVHDEGSRRALRERAALSPRREELREDLEALHRAQVAERNVPLVRVEAAYTFNTLRGARGFGIGGSLGVPWRPSWPWSRREDSVPFLLATYFQNRLLFDNGFTQTTREASLQVTLNREMSLALRWVKPGLSPLDVIRESARPRVLELEYVYGFGR